MRLGDLDLLLKEMNNEKTKYTCQIDINQRASKKDVIDITLKAYRGLIFEIIKDLPTVEVPQWIPCSERLPKETGYYIATVKSKDIHETKVRPILYDNYGFGTSIDQEIIAWQPLPQPYKGE